MAQEKDTSDRVLRLEKYRLLAEGSSRVSIPYLAGAVGVSTADAVSELGQMVAGGCFGVGAYIDYTALELVLPSGTSGGAAHSAYTGADDEVRAAWQQVKSVAGEQARVWARQAARTAENVVQQAAQAATQAIHTAAAGTQAAAQHTPETTRPASSKTASRVRKAPPAGAPASAPAQQASSVPAAAPRPKRRAYVPLLLGGLAAAAAGIAGIAVSLDLLASGAFLGWAITGGGLSALGGGLLTARRSLRRRDVRYSKYQAYMTGRDRAKIPQLAAAAGVSPAKTRRDLERMTADGLLGPAAYVDSGEDALVVAPGAAEDSAAADTPADDEDRYYAIIRQLRALDAEIADARVSELTRSIEDTCAKIFRIAQEKPEKTAQLKTFMGYYLPTALKLLRNYATLEKQGISGENIDAAKKSIIRSLETLENAFRVQLDKLFSADALDAETDEDVLDTMLRRDGLAGRDFDTQEGAAEQEAEHAD